MEKHEDPALSFRWWIKALTLLNSVGITFIAVITVAIFKEETAKLAFVIFILELLIVNLAFSFWIKKIDKRLFPIPLIVTSICSLLGYLIRAGYVFFFLHQ